MINGNKKIIQITNLTVVRGKTILQKINWIINRGEQWVILGPNGAGKTTLINVLMGYGLFTEGEVEVLGNKYGDLDWREVRDKIGFVSNSLYRRIRKGEEVTETVVSGKHALINYWGKPSRADREKAEKLLKAIKCGYLFGRTWGEISQGEQQKVLIARALMTDPDILVLDEPCLGLDMAARKNFMDFLSHLIKGKRRIPIILITHDVSEISPAFTHVMLMCKGKVLGSDKKERILTSRMLTKAYGMRIRLREKKGKYSVEL